MRKDIQSEGFGTSYYENYTSDGLRIKQYLAKKLEDYIKEISGTEGRVSDISFAYHNSWLIDGLRTRGDAIKMQEWGKLN